MEQCLFIFTVWDPSNSRDRVPKGFLEEAHVAMRPCGILAAGLAVPLGFGCADSSASLAPPAPQSSSQGGRPSGALGSDGGSVPRLIFACVGDTRPPTEDDTASYPVEVITRIYEDIEALSPR